MGKTAYGAKLWKFLFQTIWPSNSMMAFTCNQGCARSRTSFYGLNWPFALINIIIMIKKAKLCGNNVIKMTLFRFIYVLQSSWIVGICINLYRQQYQAKCLLIDSSITENETSQKLLSKICYLQKCDFFVFVLMLSSWLSHWLVMRWTNIADFAGFAYFSRFSVWRLATWKQAMKQFTRAVPRKENIL